MNPNYDVIGVTFHANPPPPVSIAAWGTPVAVDWLRRSLGLRDDVSMPNVHALQGGQVLLVDDSLSGGPRIVTGTLPAEHANDVGFSRREQEKRA